jgi:hypothetical protein
MPLSQRNRAERRAVAKTVKLLAKESWEPFEPLPETIQHSKLKNLKMAYRNNLYSVQEFALGGGLVKLMIRRHDDKAVHNWKHLQRIKNEICGPDREAVEVYPKASELVDEAHMYWLWVMPADFVGPWAKEPATP